MRNQLVGALLSVGAALLTGNGAVARETATMAPLPQNARKAIYFGWDTLGATTEDVWRNREKFAETGFDGIAMPVNGETPDGRSFLGRMVIGKRQWQRSDFAKVIPKIREMTKLKGLRESYAMVYWMSSPRLKWDDDAAWARFAENMRVLCAVAKESGLKGCFIDHEDYTGKPLFKWRRGEDPSLDETLALARKRGAQVFRAMSEAYPEGRFIHDRGVMQLTPEIHSHDITAAFRAAGDLWVAFMNGAVEALPPGMRFSDGCENAYGARTVTDYRALRYSCALEAIELIDPSLRQKYLERLEVCFGKYLDARCRKDAVATPAQLAEELFGAGYLTDGVYWAYGEKYSIIDWGRKVHPRTSNETWREKLPDFAELLRVSVGDYSELRARAAAGQLTNLVTNSGCDAQTGRVTPAPFQEYVEDKQKDKARFEYDAADGCARPGCLRLAGAGCYTFGRDGVISPGDRVYVTLAAKGEHPSVNVVWRSKEFPARWNWNIGYQNLVSPCETLPNGWKRYEICMLAPSEKVDGIGFVIGGRASAEAPLKFDDIAIYRW